VNTRHDALVLFGTEEPPVASRTLQAGAWSCTFADGAVRGLRWKGIEIVRGIAYLLRDTHWGTAPGRIEHLQLTQDAERFALRFELTMPLGGATLVARARIEGHADGRFEFVVDAAPDHDIDTNRCGFVVLHPAGYAGQPLQITHTDRRAQATRFPREISPGQPVFDIRSMAYMADASTPVTCTLEADLPGRPDERYEMEDQRNWSDASYKTYVGSLLDPWPYRLPARQSFRQRIRVALGPEAGTAAAQTAQTPARATVRIGAPIGTRLPAFGLGVPEGAAGLSDEERTAVAQLRPRWLWAQATLLRDGVQADLAALAELARDSDAAVQLDVLCPDGLAPQACARLAADLCTAAALVPQAVRLCPVAYLKSYQPSDRWPDLPPLEDYAAAARTAFASAQVGGGMVTGFTELNRKRQGPQGLDFIAHTTSPIVHAPDDASVMETLESLPQIAHSVRQIWPGLAHRIGPVTLAMARNPYGASTHPNPSGGRTALAAIDPRHQALFGAAWCVGYAAALVSSGLEVLALLDAHGPSGPLLARSQPGWRRGAVVPAWQVAALLARASDGEALACQGLPAGLAGLAWRAPDGGIRLLVANTTSTAIAFSVDRPMAGRALDASSFEAAVARTGWLDARTSDAPAASREHVLAACGVLALGEAQARGPLMHPIRVTAPPVDLNGESE
jgi:hypothetical protein